MDEEDRYTRITLRIPKDLHRSLSDAADKTSKSLNAEIVGRLQVSMEADRSVEQMAFEHGFETTGLKEEIARLNKLLESQKTGTQKALEAEGKTLAAELLKHLYEEAGETIEAARQAAEELKAAGKWPIKRQPKS